MVWSHIPTICNIATSSINGDGAVATPSVLSCNLGMRASFASSFAVSAKAYW
jgi:hypothetical protein